MLLYVCCRKGYCFQGLWVGSFLTLRNELFEETIVRGDKARNFIGKGRPGREQWGKGIQENCSAMWLAVSGFMVIGLVLGCSWPVTLTHGPSWWCTHHSAKMGSREDSGSLVGCMDWVSSLLVTFPEFFQLMIARQCLIPCQDLWFKITQTSGFYYAWPSWVISVCVSPNT